MQPRPLVALARARMHCTSPSHFRGQQKVMAGGLYKSVFLLGFILCTISVVGSSLSAVVERPPCNQTLPSLFSLRETVINLNRQSTDSDYVICVNLQAQNMSEGIDYSPMSIDSMSVIITGISGSVIKCRNEQQLPLSNYTQFPLIFTNSSLVIIEGVQFEGCMRPLRFKWVTRIEIISSTFR